MMRAAPGAAILGWMATLVAIGYPDETTAEAARQTVASLEDDLIIQADYGGTVIKTSLSEEATRKLQEALTPTDQVGAAS
jgi:uncharacterized membrane protein